MTEQQAEKLIHAINCIELSDTDYTDHFNGLDWQLNEMRKHLEDIANALKVIANK
jgi:hypothetical protein